MRDQILIAACVLGVAGGCAPPPCDDGPCLVAEDLAGSALAVRAPADDDVWIVGSSPEDASDGPLAAHWDGVAWDVLDMSQWPGLELWSAWVCDAEVVLVGSAGTIIEYDRVTRVARQVAAHDDPSAVFFTVWGASGSDLWAVGRGGTADGEPGLPLLWRRIDGTWMEWDDPLYDGGAAGDILLTVHGTSVDDVWIVGSAGTALHWDGRGLRRIPTDQEIDTLQAPIMGVDASAGRPMAVGGPGLGTVLSWDGGRWASDAPDPYASYHGLCAAPDGSAMVVGNAGARATRIDGEWRADHDLGITPMTMRDYHACAWTPSGAVWTVGGHFASRPLRSGVVAYTGADAIEPL